MTLNIIDAEPSEMMKSIIFIEVQFEERYFF